MMDASRLRCVGILTSGDGQSFSCDIFRLPLVLVFVLASKTTDAFQMAKWSSRNVIPAKIALGMVFLLLGILMILGLNVQNGT